jgi:biopolymer transport protein ExbB
MKRMKLWMILLSIPFLSAPVHGEDMRAASKKAKAEYEASVAEAGKAEERILADRKALQSEVARLQKSVKELEASIKAMNNEVKQLREKGEGLSEKWAKESMNFRELTGVVRTAARDLNTLLSNSYFSARFTQRLDNIAPLLKKERFPGIDEIKEMMELLFQEAKLTGEVVLRQGRFVDRRGREKEGHILTVGRFTAAYRDGNEISFLKYSEAERRFFALSTLPSWSVRRNLMGYMEGKDNAVTVDLSGGGALRQITHRPGLIEQCKKGGPIVWPILAIGFFSLILILERIMVLKRIHGKTEKVMERVNALASQGKWEECQDIVNQQKGRPVNNVLAAGLSSRGEDRETLESIIQEAILKELPRLERFLPTLNIMGAIAPLLGLLGTVTGMINTFHVITLYGTGDPKMMSGGISEALVTTMLGLSMAIPIMLISTFLSRRVEHITGEMEEKAVALVNIIQKQKMNHVSS